ncbi:MAG: hypothetical protein JW841_00085, partial [Deltaproteobacteria bacterium]|nr:hypothetical protein [Deltaproteobacteria bacterium]
MKKWRIKHLAILAATIVTFSSNNIYATSGQPSGKRLIPYDGTLRDDGVEANGNFDFVFFLCNTADATVCTISNYDDLSNPTNLGEGIIWVESFTSENNNPVFVANGKFAVMLGEIKDLTDEVFATDELYLGIAVRPEGGAYVELTNRQRITPNAYVHARQGGVDNFIVPRGAVMFFNLTACPIGWSAMSNAEGRVVVGVGSSGTVAG